LAITRTSAHYSVRGGNGFVPQVNREVASRFKGLEIDTVCEFAGAETNAMGFDQRRNEKLHVEEPQLVAQIEFTEWTPDGHLRHSKFVGLREDKSIVTGQT
jgi:ATP-dependent DNA ligase